MSTNPELVSSVEKKVDYSNHICKIHSLSPDGKFRESMSFRYSMYHHIEEYDEHGEFKRGAVLFETGLHQYILVTDNVEESSGSGDIASSQRSAQTRSFDIKESSGSGDIQDSPHRALSRSGDIGSLQNTKFCDIGESSRSGDTGESSRSGDIISFRTAHKVQSIKYINDNIIILTNFIMYIVEKGKIYSHFTDVGRDHDLMCDLNAMDKKKPCNKFHLVNSTHF